MNMADVERVLDWAGSFDDLTEQDQTIVQATWRDRIAARRAALDFETEFRATGESWSEADEDGNIVYRNPRGTA